MSMDDIFGSAGGMLGSALSFAVNPGGFIADELFGSTATKNDAHGGGDGGNLSDMLVRGGGGGAGGGGGGSSMPLGEMSGDLFTGGGGGHIGGGSSMPLGGLAAFGPGSDFTSGPSSSSHGGGNIGQLAMSALGGATTGAGSKWKSK